SILKLLKRRFPTIMGAFLQIVILEIDSLRMFAICLLINILKDFVSCLKFKRKQVKGTFS
ncbi:MAG: hypothetical protein QW575_01470, partial [Thermoproteota archaeon]